MNLCFIFCVCSVSSVIVAKGNSIKNSFIGENPLPQKNLGTGRSEKCLCEYGGGFCEKKTWSRGVFPRDF